MKIEQFRHFKATIRQEKQYLLIGIDASKDSSVACFYNIEKGILLKKYYVKHSITDFQEFTDKIQSLQTLHDLRETIVAVEPTGNYHKVLCQYLKEHGCQVVYVSSVAIKNNRRTIDSGRWGKNDPKDAYNIVDLLAQGKILFYRDEFTASADMRKYLSLRRQLTRAKTALLNRIQNNIWTCHFPELSTLLKANDPDTLSLLEHCPSAQQVKVLDFDSFLKFFNPLRSTRSKRCQRLSLIWQTAQTSIGYPAMPSVLWEARLLASQLRTINTNLEQIDRTLADFCLPNDNYQVLLSMPGFGIFTVSVFKAIIGDISAFSDAKQILKLAGLDLETMSSGSFQGQERISKKGNSLLRYALCHAVNIALAKNKNLKELFEYKLKTLGNTRKAKAKLKIKFAAKFLRIAFTLLKKQVPFDINCFKVLVEDPV